MARTLIECRVLKKTLFQPFDTNMLFDKKLFASPLDPF